jgi:hypothetical protein
MKTFKRWLLFSGVLLVTRAGIADDAKDHQADKLRGITCVTVTVTDRSKIPGMPPEAVVQSALENLLQAKCNLGIIPAPTNPTPGWGKVHVDLLMVPVPLANSKTGAVALVRTSVLRPVFLVAADGQSPDTSKTLNLAAWISTTVSDPSTDPQLANTLLGHVSALQAILREAGQNPPLPPGYSEAFFASQLPAIHDKLQALFKAQLLTKGFIPAITVDPLKFDKGVLTYKIRGTITVGAAVADIDAANPPRDLNLAALATIGSLPNGKFFLNIPGQPSLTATVSDLFQ